MQAIARVNRVFGEKPGGLIVDLLGLTDQLADALATYTEAGGTGEAVKQVQDEAVPAMQASFREASARSSMAATTSLAFAGTSRSSVLPGLSPGDRPCVRPERRLEAPTNLSQGIVGSVRACGAPRGDGTRSPRILHSFSEWWR